LAYIKSFSRQEYRACGKLIDERNHRGISSNLIEGSQKSPLTIRNIVCGTKEKKTLWFLYK